MNSKIPQWAKAFGFVAAAGILFSISPWYMKAAIVAGVLVVTLRCATHGKTEQLAGEYR